MTLITEEEKREVCELFYEQAKKTLCETGGHSMMIFAVYEDQIVMIPNIMQLDKYEFTSMVSHVARQTDAKALICISEMWASMMDVDDERTKDPSFQPSKDPEAKEGLSVMVTDPYGDTCAKIGFFKKVDDKIVFEDEECLDSATMNMIPPWKEKTIH